MVAEAKNVRIWKPENQVIRVLSESVISWIKQKNEFSRGEMEKALGLTLGQAEWHIKNLLKKRIIKHTNKFVYKIGKGQKQAIYKYIENKKSL